MGRPLAPVRPRPASRSGSLDQQACVSEEQGAAVHGGSHATWPFVTSVSAQVTSVAVLPACLACGVSTEGKSPTGKEKGRLASSRPGGPCARRQP